MTGETFCAAPLCWKWARFPTTPNTEVFTTAAPLYGTVIDHVTLSITQRSIGDYLEKNLNISTTFYQNSLKLGYVVDENT